MRMFIRSSASWPDACIDFTRTRLEFSFGRFRDCVRSLTVRLTDVDRPGGHPDRKCVIAVRLSHPRRVIVIEDVDPDHFALVSRAVERAARAVSRAVRTEDESRGLHAGSRI